MKTYQGYRQGDAVSVTVDRRRLNPRWDLSNHGPTGFDWNNGGNGAAQLALAILADHCSDDEQAVNFYQRFKWLVIAELPRHHWTLTTREIDQVLHTIRIWKPFLEAVS